MSQAVRSDESARDGAGLSADEKALLKLVPSNGESIGNRTLQRRLNWKADHYWAVRDALVDAGYIVRGRGLGGSVKRIVGVKADAETPAIIDVAAVAAYERERELYEPMRRVIERDWAWDHRSRQLIVEITAQQGGRDTGGVWSRPDITSVEVGAFQYVPCKHLEITTFEAKRAETLSVQAVYEALAHRRSATRSYVVAHVPDIDAISDTITLVESVARSHGVGFVTMKDPSDYGTWEERVEAERIVADPPSLDRFIATQLNEQAKEKIRLWLR